jgi:hypothetical protein
MFTDSRLLPASGMPPMAGQDIQGTLWQEMMRAGEIALFCFDARSGQLLTAKGEVPQTPLSEYCMAFRSLYMARRVAKGRVTSNPRMMCVLYDKRGRWLATLSRLGEDRRNPGLGLAWVLFQFPLLAFLGTVAIFVMSTASAQWFGTEPLRWQHMTAQEWNGIFVLGLLLGGAGKLLFEWARYQMVLRHARPALQPVGSPERDALYRRLARTTNPNLLVPLDITFTATSIEWPSPEKYAAWAEVLGREGFEQFGEYLIPETRTLTEFWLNSREDLTATIVNHPRVGMWLAVSTRYEDWSSFGVANKNETGVDPHPTKRIVYVGPDADAITVIEKARRDRPAGVRRHPTRDRVLSDYATSWRQHVEWRRARGTTVDEFKRVSERKARAKAAGTPWP